MGNRDDGAGGIKRHLSALSICDSDQVQSGLARVFFWRGVVFVQQV